MNGDTPSSWRDVYTLVRDTRKDLMAEVQGLGTEVAGLGAKVDTHLLEHAISKGQRQQTDRIFGIARSSLAVIISIGALGVTLYNALS